MKTSIQKKRFANGVQTTALNSQTYRGTFYSAAALVRLKINATPVKRTVPFIRFIYSTAELSY